MGLPDPELEYMFANDAKCFEGLPIRKTKTGWKKDKGRKWRIDVAFPAARLAVEIEGGVFTGGRHTRGAGFMDDMEKYNELSMMRWHLLRFTPKEVSGGRAANEIERWFNGMG